MYVTYTAARITTKFMYSVRLTKIDDPGRVLFKFAGRLCALTLQCALMGHSAFMQPACPISVNDASLQRTHLHARISSFISSI